MPDNFIARSTSTPAMRQDTTHCANPLYLGLALGAFGVTNQRPKG
jgi:hypothetical protein